MDETKKKNNSTHDSIIFGYGDDICTRVFLLVDWYQFQGLLRWSLILFFMYKSYRIITMVFKRYALVNVLFGQ